MGKELAALSLLRCQWFQRTLLSAGTLGLSGKSDPDQAVLGLELLQSLGGVVDEGEAGGLAATELGAQAEDLDLLLLGLVQAGELLAQLSLGDVGTVGVEDVTICIEEKRSAHESCFCPCDWVVQCRSLILSTAP